MKSNTTRLAAHRAQQYRLGTNDTEVRNTNCGKVKGVKRKTIYDEYYYAFEGIPYGRPPIGELRFRAPQPVDAWEGVRDCTTYHTKPMQKHLFLNMVEGSEDCLYLNVYVKSLQTETPLPVMVWIHGGGYQIGEATRDIYAPDYFMQHNVILVTITYRLSALGFISFNNDPDLGVPGNAGLKDQILALRWVKNNIANFNGDAGNITLMGESAGAASAQILMCCPHTKGLFHKAILMSGSVLCPWGTFPQHDWAYRLAHALGYSGTNNDKQIFRFLTKIEARKIVNASSKLLNREEKREHLIGAFGPTIEPYETDDAVIIKPILEMLRQAWSNDLPVIIGGTSFEGLFCYLMPKFDPYVVNELGNCEVMVPADAKARRSDKEIRTMGLELKRVYFDNKEPCLQQHFYQYLDLTSHSLMWHGIYRTLLARLSYAPQSPTYLYRFDFDSPDFNQYRILKCGRHERGVCHADDLSYLFYTIAAWKLSPDSKEYKTIQRMTGMWVAFAQRSDPNCAKIAPVVWAPMASDAQENDIECLNISDEVKVIKLPEREKLEIWNKFYTKETLY